MPSASTKLEKQTPIDVNDPMKQIVTIVEKKVRNLEKRKSKLDSYKQDSQNGKELNEDQKKAIEKYDQVVELLDFAKELQKQFQGVVQESTKALKKTMKREQLERQHLELQRVKEIMVYQDLLSSMGSEDVRQDFLEGSGGAVKLSEEELNGLDELYKVICPERDSESENADFDAVLMHSAEHIQALLDAKNKEAFGVTYKVLRETLQKIHSCSYFNKSKETPAEEAQLEVAASEESEDKNISEELHQGSKIPEVEDFVFVDKSEDYMLEKSSGQLPQVERPYFPMEAPPIYAEQTRPIQEVLSGQGSLNFLQESQIEVAETRPGPNTPTTHMTSPSFGSVYSPSLAAQQHHLRPPAEDPSLVPSNHTSVPPTVPASDFDPGRPIPTQTYTNQSFSSVVHPMMAGYVPAPSLPHGMAPPHQVMPVVPQRGVLGSGGLVVPLANQQQASVQSLCVNMNQLNSENSQAALASTVQYDCNEMRGNMVKHPSFVNNSSNHSVVNDSRVPTSSNAFSRGVSQVEYGSERAYQSTNINQAYLNQDNFGVDTSSYSSNLKRGLNSRGGARNLPRGNAARGARMGYRN